MLHCGDLKTRNSQIQFIRLNGAGIAACPWNGYKEKGRGMICVLSDLENELLQQVPFDFMPESDAAKVMKPWYGTKESRMVAGYDPEREVVICFVRGAGGDRTDFDCYKIITKPTPPLASEEAD
jgi:hypothetical protein